MRISVVTVCFNSERTIADCAASVLAQRGIDVDYIIIDGGSKDNTLARLAPYRDGVATLVSERDRGIYDAMNKGLARAKGEFVGFLNSDDFFSSPDALAKLACALDDSKADAAFGDIAQINAAGRLLRIYSGDNFKMQKLTRGRYPPHPGFYARTGVLRELGGFNTDLRIAADFDLMIRFFTRPGMRWVYVPERIVTMRAGGASHQGLMAYVSNSQEIVRACKDRGLKPSHLAIYGRVFRKGLEAATGLVQGHFGKSRS